MSAYVLVVFVHITAAAILVGGSVLAGPAVRAGVRRVRSPQELRPLLAVARLLEVTNPVSALLVLGTGVYLTTVAHFWALGWVQVAVAAWFLSTGVALVVVNPIIRTVAAESGSDAGPVIGERLDALRRSGTWTWGGDLLAANDTAMLFLMTVKPTLGGSLAALLLANGAVLIGRTLVGPRSARARTAVAP
jgi:uncharacterized membrane protein